MFGRGRKDGQQPEQQAQRQISLRGLDLVFDGVTFAYGQAGPVLHDINLTVPAGQFVAVLGANGSGKSTLAKHVNGLLAPTQGTVRFGGYSTADPDALMVLRRRVGMVFQNPDNQTVASIVRDDVAFGPENLGLPAQEIRKRVDEALESVAMTAHADAEVFSLSGGQKQRIAIAGALAMRPDVLVLDEPGAMLDVRGRRGITRVAHELNAEGMTILLVTHFMEDALGADRIIVLDRGRVALDGTPQEVFTDVERLERLRLDLPFSVKLAQMLQQSGVQVSSGLDEELLEEELCRLYSTM